MRYFPPWGRSGGYGISKITGLAGAEVLLIGLRGGVEVTSFLTVLWLWGHLVASDALCEVLFRGRGWVLTVASIQAAEVCV